MPPSGEAPARAAAAGGGLRLETTMAEPIDWQYKAFPVADQPVRIGDAGEQGWNALKPPFSTPVMVLKDRALQHNIDLMAAYCSAHGLSLAPHTKTPVPHRSPTASWPPVRGPSRSPTCTRPGSSARPARSASSWLTK